MREIEQKYAHYGTDLAKLIAWLQQPKQGVLPQVAASVIKEVYDELEAGNEWFREALMYPEGFRKIMAEGKLPDCFWLDNYVLERCRWVQEDMIAGHETLGPLRLEERLMDIEQIVLSTNRMLKPIKAFLTVPPYLRKTGRAIKWFVRMITYGWAWDSYRWIRNKRRRV